MGPKKECPSSGIRLWYVTGRTQICAYMCTEEAGHPCGLHLFLFAKKKGSCMLLYFCLGVNCPPRQFPKGGLNQEWCQIEQSWSCHVWLLGTTFLFSPEPLFHIWASLLQKEHSVSAVGGLSLAICFFVVACILLTCWLLCSFTRWLVRWMRTSLWRWLAQMQLRFSICILGRDALQWVLMLTWLSGTLTASRRSLPRLIT